MKHKYLNWLVALTLIGWAFTPRMTLPSRAMALSSATIPLADVTEAAPPTEDIHADAIQTPRFPNLTPPSKPETVTPRLLRLRTGTFDPLTTTPRIPTSLLRTQTPSTPTLHLIQFNGPIQDQWREQMDTLGLEVVTYIPDYAYLVWGRRAAVSALQASTPTRWSGDYHAFYALHPRLTLLEDSPEQVKVLLQVYNHPKAAAIITRILQRAETILRPPYTSLAYWNLGIQIEAQKLRWLSALPGVVNVEPYPEYRPFDEVQGQIMAGHLNAAGTLPTGPGYLHWLTHTVGFSTAPDDYPVVDITDDGIDDGDANPSHADFYEFGESTNADRLIYNRNWTGDASADSGGGHGNLNAAIVGGYNSQTGTLYQDTDGYHYGLGINPFGRLGGSKVFNNDGAWDHAGTDEEVVSASYESGARISTNSWGCGPPWCNDAPYTVDAQNYDAMVRDAVADSPGNQEMVILFAAGNDGTDTATIGAPATAKNVIAVGASENVRPTWTDGCGDGPTEADSAQDIADFSSRGPTSDGRIKPDLVAPGTHIQGAASQSPNYNGTGVCDAYYPPGQTLYAASSGTSHATPAVAGAASLIYRYYQDHVGDGTPPSPAMVKAYLINTTRYLTGTGTSDALPSNAQGYGLVNLGAAFDGAAQLALDQSVVFTQTGDIYELYGQIDDVDKPLRVTLAWSDAPGPTVGDAFVNDLDLEVIIDGETYVGNHFSDTLSTEGVVSIPGGSADPRNNVESVYIPAPGSASETFLVRIRATNIAGDGLPNNADATDQDFALIIYNAQPPRFSTLQGMVYEAGTSPMTKSIASAHIQAVGLMAPDTLSTWSTSDGTYTLSLMGDTYILTTAAYGYRTYTHTEVTIQPGELMTHHIPLTRLPTTVVSGTVRDGSGQGWPLYARIDVAPSGMPSMDRAPSTDDMGGIYFTHPASGTYAVTLPVGLPFTFTVHAVSGGYQPVTRVITPTSPSPGRNTEPFILTVDSGACSGDNSPPGYTDTCTPIEGGGLIVGNVYNAADANNLNTDIGVNGAFVMSRDYPTDTTTTWATPDDPALNDGFYILFSPRIGTHVLETGAFYVEQTHSLSYVLTDTRHITIAADTVTVQDFTLHAPTMAINPKGFDVVLTPGYQTTRKLTFFNQGSADLDWRIRETRPHLHENSPLINGIGTGPSGFDESVLQDLSSGMTSLGFNHAAAVRHRLADDFTIGEDESWSIDTVTFFAYQTGSPVGRTGIATSTITSVTLRIWGSGPPNAPDSFPVFGDTTTNRLAHTTWSGIYRTSESTINTERPIMANTVDVGITLMPGTYWLDWQSDGTLTSGPWAPPLTIDGQTTTGNALLFNGTAWETAQDSGSNTQQGFPFLINGQADLIPWVTPTPVSNTMTAPTTSIGDLQPTMEQITLTFDATDMSPGVYTGTLFILHNAPATAAGAPSSEPLTRKLYPIEVPITLTVQSHGLLLNPATDAKIGMPGERVTYTLRLTNTGIVADSFHLSTDADWPLYITASPMLTDTIGPLAPHTGTDVQVIVDIPTDALGGVQDTITLTATAAGATESQQGDPTVRATSRLTTAVARVITITTQPGELHAILNPDTSARTVLEIKSLGTLTASWTITEAPARPWLHVDPYEGATAPRETSLVNLEIQADGMIPGTYTTTLSILSSAAPGIKTTISPQIEMSVTLSVVTGCIPVKALALTYAPPAPRAGEPITFTGDVQATLLTANTQPITYTWDFGDALPLVQGPKVQHVYPIAGVYTPTLIGRNACSTARVRQRITVTGEPRLTVDPRSLTTTLTPGITTTRELTLSNPGTAPLTWQVNVTPTIQWLSASPMSGTLAPRHHERLIVSFTAPAIVRPYTSTLIVYSDAPTAPQVDIPITLSVKPPPCQAVHITALESNSPVIVGETLHVTATVSGDAPLTPTWDLPGISSGTHLTTLTPSLIYDEVGTHTITLHIANGCPTSDTRAITVTVQPQPPPCVPVSIEHLESDSPTPLGERTHFTATVRGSAPMTYTWDFNSDRIPEQSGTTLSRTTYLYPLATTYIAPHAYIATLHVRNHCPSSATQTLQVNLHTPATACAPVTGTRFTYSPDTPKVGETIHFNGYVDQGTLPITWIWAFGDGNSERLESMDGGVTISHTYTLRGTYTVVMTTTNCAGSSSMFTTQTLTVTPTRYVIHLPLITRNYGG